MTRARRASSARILRLRTRRSSSVRSSGVNVTAIWRYTVPVRFTQKATSAGARPKHDLARSLTLGNQLTVTPKVEAPSRSDTGLVAIGKTRSASCAQHDVRCGAAAAGTPGERHLASAGGGAESDWRIRWRGAPARTDENHHLVRRFTGSIGAYSSDADEVPAVRNARYSQRGRRAKKLQGPITEAATAASLEEVAKHRARRGRPSKRDRAACPRENIRTSGCLRSHPGHVQRLGEGGAGASSAGGPGSLRSRSTKSSMDTVYVPRAASYLTHDTVG